MNPPDGYGFLSHFYEFLEMATLGNLLSRARLAHLSALAPCTNILIIGEGDGRFLQALLKVNHSARITVVEKSPGMAERLKKRLAGWGETRKRYTLHIADLRWWTPDPAGGSFDAVVTHFFWDQFRPSLQRELAWRLDPWLTEDALWMCADFLDPVQEGNSSVRALLQHWILECWYLFFQRSAGVQSNRLHSHRSLLAHQGWHLEASCSWVGDWIVSDVWRKYAFPHPANEVNS